MSICPLLHTLFFHLVVFFMLESHTCVLIFGIDTFGIRRHKINSEEFNISDETLVRPYGD